MSILSWSLRLIIVLASMQLFSCKSSSVINEDAATYRLQISSSLIKNGNYPEALRQLLQAEKEDPKNPYIQANLGLVYFYRERYELSEKHYLEALSLKPDFTDAKNSLAHVYLEVDRLTKAEKYIKEAHEDLTYSAYQRTYTNFGVLEFKKQNYRAAIGHFKKALERDRENCQTHTYLGRAFTEVEDYSSALVQFEKGMTFCSQTNSDEAHYYSAIALYRSKSRNEALARFETSLQLFPEGKNAEKSRKMIALIRRGAE